MTKEFIAMLIDPATWQQTDFQCGYFAGVLVALITIMVLMILRIIIGIMCLPRRCRSITIASSDGDMDIAAEAITDLIKSLQPEFPHLGFDKLKLYRHGKKQSIQLQISFNTEKGGMPEQFEELKTRVRYLLKETFGINSIRKVSIHCHRVVIPEGSMAPRPPVFHNADGLESESINHENAGQQ